MSVERLVRILAGALILLALGLAHFDASIDLSRLSWLWFVGFIGVNLLQSGFTGFCPPARLFRWLGFRETGSACEL